MTNDPTERNAESTPDGPNNPGELTPTSPDQGASPLLTQLQPLLDGLLYPSESDEPVTSVTCYLTQDTPLTVSQIKDWQMLPPAIYVDEMPLDDFWSPVISEQDWYGDDEKKRTAGFKAVKALLDAQLSAQQVFRVGETERTVYLLGRTTDGTRAGLQTLIVQT